MQKTGFQNQELDVRVNSKLKMASDPTQVGNVISETCKSRGSNCIYRGMEGDMEIGFESWQNNTTQTILTNQQKKLRRLLHSKVIASNNNGLYSFHLLAGLVLCLFVCFFVSLRQGLTMWSRLAQ